MGWQPEPPRSPSKTLTSFLKQRSRQQQLDGGPHSLPLRLKRTAVGTAQSVARRKPLGEGLKRACQFMSKLLQGWPVSDSMQECGSWQLLE